MSVVIASNIIKQSERINKEGDVIDPRTKRIIRPASVDATPAPTSAPEPVQAPAPSVAPTPVSSSMADIIDALARKNVEAIKAQVEARTVELLKESIK